MFLNQLAIVLVIRAGHSTTEDTVSLDRGGRFKLTNQMAYSIIQVRVSTETPAKNGVFDGGVASFRVEKLALSQRTRRDDFKLAVSGASWMNALSTMQKETKICHVICQCCKYPAQLLINKMP